MLREARLKYLDLALLPDANTLSGPPEKRFKFPNTSLLAAEPVQGLDCRDWHLEACISVDRAHQQLHILLWFRRVQEQMIHLGKDRVHSKESEQVATVWVSLNFFDKLGKTRIVPELGDESFPGGMIL